MGCRFVCCVCISYMEPEHGVCRLCWRTSCARLPHGRHHRLIKVQTRASSKDVVFPVVVSAYVDGVLVGPHLAAAAAELEKWDQGKWQLKGQYHLQGKSSQGKITYQWPALFTWSRRGTSLLRTFRSHAQWCPFVR